MSAHQHHHQFVVSPEWQAITIPRLVRPSRLSAAAVQKRVSQAVKTALVAMLALIAGIGCNPSGSVINEANELSDRVYEMPEQAAKKAVERIIDIQKSKFENPWIIRNDVFSKIREDFYLDRFSLSMCQHYLTIGEANFQMGAYEAASQSFHGAVEAANKWVGYHIQFITNATPAIYRAIKAFFRSKKIEVVAYLKLREIARRMNNAPLAAVYDMKARYAKLYLDSMVSLEEERGVTDWEKQSYIQDDDEFLTDVETVAKFLIVIVVVIVASSQTRSLLGQVWLAGVATRALASIVHHHQTMKAAIRFRTLSVGLGSIKNAADRIANLPELQNIPSFAEFRASVERAKQAAEAGDDTAAAEAFIDSYDKLNAVENELLALRKKYDGSSDGTAAPGVGELPDARGGAREGVTVTPEDAGISDDTGTSGDTGSGDGTTDDTDTSSSGSSDTGDGGTSGGGSGGSGGSGGGSGGTGEGGRTEPGGW